MVKNSATQKTIQFFSSLADKTRLKIILSIAEKPKNVNEILKNVSEGKLTLSAISHQLRMLSDLGIVTSERYGKEKFFELSDKYCWCILKDTFSQFGNKLKIGCKKCK